MSERADPWAETTYNGFAGAAELPPPQPRTRRLPSRKVVLGGVAAGLALGAVLGLAARPDLGKRAPDAAPMQAVPRASSAMLNIEVNKPAILPAPKAAGRLEVLSPDLARTAPRIVTPHIEPRAVAEPDCSTADSVAEQLICEDPALSRADQRMHQAYTRALRSGAMPRRELRNEQLDWLAARDSAARRSPFEVRSLYEQRIDELNALAEDGRG
ncbi:MAG: lysozyme inhibitor LprI family protein [Phenylobacterium sp.]